MLMNLCSPARTAVLGLLFAAALAAADNPPVLAIGAAAPDFSLPGVDGRNWSLADFADKPVLAVMFTAPHCPTAQLYEGRIKQLVSDFSARGVAFVAIQPNSSKALRLDEMGYTDVGDTFADMKVRAEHRKFNFPFLYDGDGQEISKRYGPSATPHVFLFDRERKLRYQGRVDNNQRQDIATVADTRLALEAMLAGKPVPVATTPTVGCSIKWAYKEAGRVAEQQAQAAEPVTVQPITAEALKALRRNGTGKTLLVNFWTTWCGPCITEFPELQRIWRMYRRRPFDMVTVSANAPDEEKGVRRVLDEHKAITRNYLFNSAEPYPLMAAFDSEWNGAVPYTMLIGPDGTVLYKVQGPFDALELKRRILASFPDDDYRGQKAYWNSK